jgi:hypothetical protein
MFLHIEGKGTGVRNTRDRKKRNLEEEGEEISLQHFKFFLQY